MSEDQVPIQLSPALWVLPQASIDRYGREFFQRLHPGPVEIISAEDALAQLDVEEEDE